MAGIEKQIKDWSDHGLISPEQALKILAHEASKPKSSWIQYGLLILGIFVTGLGIISMIAANWNEINDYVKLSVDFTLLSSIALLAFNAHQTKKLVIYDSLVLAMQVSALATIGLIAQIFHTSGHLYQAILFWCAITLPIVLSSSFMFVPLIWIFSFLCATSNWLMDSTLFSEFFHRRELSVVILSPLLVSILTFIGRKINVSRGTIKALQLSLLIAGLAGMAIIEATRRPSLDSRAYILSLFPAYIFSVVVLGLLWASEFFKPFQRRILTALLGMYVLSFHVTLLAEPKALYFAVITISELGLIGLYLASLKERKGFNLILMLAGLRFFALFIEALGGLAATGMGLILSGVILIALASVWHRRRHEIAQWAERIAQ